MGEPQYHSVENIYMHTHTHTLYSFCMKCCQSKKVAFWKVDQCLPRSTGRERKLSTKEHRELLGLTEVLYDLNVICYIAQCLPKPVEINTQKNEF